MNRGDIWEGAARVLSFTAIGSLIALGAMTAVLVVRDTVK